MEICGECAASVKQLQRAKSYIEANGEGKPFFIEGAEEQQLWSS